MMLLVDYLLVNFLMLDCKHPMQAVLKRLQ